MIKKLLLLLLFSHTLNAQVLPGLEFQEEDLIPAKISELIINVEITGTWAETTIETLFYNPNDRILEGQFSFPLSDGQKITGFALDIEGKLRDASVVEKAKARKAYEATIRQNIDPGLIEKGRGNTYKARIFPIPAKGYKRTKIIISEVLPVRDGYSEYRLPVKSDHLLDRFSLTVKKYINSTEKEEIQGSLNFSSSRDASISEITRENYRIMEDIYIRFPVSENFIIEKESFFFAQTDISDLLTEREAEPELKKTVVLWDISASSEKRNFTREWDFLLSYLKTLKTKSSVEIIPFHINPLPSKTFTAGDGEKIESYLKTLAPEGATRFSSINFKALKGDEILLFSDGLSTFDSQSEYQLPEIPIHTISSSGTGDTSFLQFLSWETGGAFFPLFNGSMPFKKQLRLLKTEGKGVSEIYTDLSLNSPILTLTGKLTGDEGEVEIIFSTPAGKEVSRTLKIQKGKTDTQINTEKIWAGKKLDYLDLRYEKNREEITALGKQYTIVTRNSSLIVLDRVEDYVTHEITPPDELKEEYMRLLKEKQQSLRDLQTGSLAEALNAMEALKEWWNKDFPRTRPEPPVIKSGEDSGLSPEGPPGVEGQTPPAFRAESDRRWGVDMDSESLNEEAEEPEAKKSQSQPIEDSIHIVGWTPDMPYIEEIKKARGKDILPLYKKLKTQYKDLPAFYMDIAMRLYEENRKEEAVLVVSNILETDIEEPELLRVTMYLLELFGSDELALIPALKVLQIREEEPQSLRDLARLYENTEQYQKALESWYGVLSGTWDRRFNGIKSVVLNEMNAMISVHRSELDLSDIDERLIFPMPLDVRIVISWSSDNSDIDLWVIDPYEDRCSYNQKRTHTGGKLSSDMTRGYGPEEFSIKKALFGYYGAEIKFYSDNRMSVSGPVTIRIDFIKNFGKKNMQRETIVRRLSDVKGIIPLGKIEFK